MAILKNGILGGFKGKVGSVVGYEVYNQACMRALGKRSAQFTRSEIANTSRFGLIQKTLSLILELVQVGFKNYYTKSGGIRGAISYNRRFAMGGTETDFFIDPEKFRFSGGDLPGAGAPQFTLEDSTIRFIWDADVPEDADAYDQVMLLAIDFEGFNASSAPLNEFRYRGAASLDLSVQLKGKEICVYLGFAAKDRSRQSESQYLGKILVPAD